MSQLHPVNVINHKHKLSNYLFVVIINVSGNFLVYRINNSTENEVRRHGNLQGGGRAVRTCLHICHPLLSPHLAHLPTSVPFSQLHQFIPNRDNQYEQSTKLRLL